MANRITITQLDPSKFVDKGSRYVKSKVLYYGNRNLLTFDIYKRNSYPNSDKDRYTVIPPGLQYRPDKMSQMAYGLPDFWWKIMEANGIFDVYDFKAGLNIRLPQNIY